MIGKITKGKSFSGLCGYILEHEKAELIETNMVAGNAYILSKQLKATWDLNYRVKYPTVHFSLSFSKDERPPIETVKEISTKFLIEMGFENNPYFVAEHDDCDHYHIHIGASRITFEGKCIDAWKDKTLCEKTLRKLEDEYDLVRVKPSNEVAKKAPSTGQVRRLKREQEEYEFGLREFSPEVPVKMKLQSAIDSVVSENKKISMKDFLLKLKKKGVSSKIKISEDGEIQGVSYAMDGVAFAGRKLGRNELSCTLSGLQKRGVDISLMDLTQMVKHSKYESSENIRKIMNHKNNQSLLFSNSVKSKSVELTH